MIVSGPNAPRFPNESAEETAIRAIEAYKADPQTTYTPRNIIDDFGDEIVAALALVASGRL